MFKKIPLYLALTTTLVACSSHEQAMYSASTIAPLTSLYSYQVINSTTQLPVSLKTLAKALKNTDIVFIGEIHRHPGAHLLQLQLFEELYKQNSNLVLSMEQFERDVQPVLNKYLTGEYGEKTLIDDGRAWKDYRGTHRAIVEFAKEHHIPIIAANAPNMHVRCVGMNGPEFLDNLPKEQVAWSATTLALDNESYKEKYLSFMKEVGQQHGHTFEMATKRQMNSFAAQLLRDTTMAESIINAMEQYPDAMVVHLNGAFHSDGHLGTVSILENMKSSLQTTVLSPVEVKNSIKPIVTNEQLAQGEYIYMLRHTPKRFIDKDKRDAAIRELIKKRMKNKCEV